MSRLAPTPRRMNPTTYPSTLRTPPTHQLIYVVALALTFGLSRRVSGRRVS